jgi:Xaa-Pro aminopeptidase
MSDRDGRLAQLRELLPGAEVDGLVVSAPGNIFYLSGFRGSSGALLVTDQQCMLFSDFRYRLQAKEQAPDFEFVEVPRRLLAAVGEAAAAAGVSRLGYNPSHLSCELRDQLSEGAGSVPLAPAGALVEEMRATKSEEEVGLISAAAALADRALAHMAKMLRAGATEREVALEGEFYMRREGAEAASFDVIVASGPRSALPHAETTDRELATGDSVVIDIGARFSGYCSDITRTFAVGSAPPEMGEVYKVVYQAQRAAAAGVQAGVICGDVDGIARKIIEDAGYSDSFGHGLGHGVGIDVHEAPRLGKGEKKELAPGNVVTVEPGIYLEGTGGVRLEDLLVVFQNGSETITGSPMPSELPVV